MDFALSAAEQEWQDKAIAFARAELCDPENAQREQAGGFWREGWNRAARFGAQGLPIPEAYGGQGQGIVGTVAAMEGLGYGSTDLGLLFTVNASLWTVSMPILEFGTDDQKKRLLPPLNDGTLVGANAASEPEAGSDIFSMQTRAEKKGDGWVLNGRKIWITGAPAADLLLVFATTDPARGVLGVTCFIVPMDNPGVKCVRDIPKLGLKTAPMGEIVFENCELPSTALLGREGRGSKIFNAALEWERGAILGPFVGALRRQLEQCVAYSRERVQFGKPIGKNQAISHRLVDMSLRLQTCRLMLYRFAWLKGQGKDASIEASLTKLHLSESALANSIDAIRIHGARGVLLEEPFEAYLRDAMCTPIFSGTSDIQRNIIAGPWRL